MNHAKVLTLVGDMDGSALWRCFLPISELQRQGYAGIEWGYRQDDRLTFLLHKFDAIILPRLSWEPAEWENGDRWIGAFHKAGMAVIYEADDDLYSDDFVRRLIYEHGKSKEDAEMYRACALRAMRQCDGVTVSNQRLATITRSLTDKSVKVVPNFIDLRWFKQVQKANRRDPKLTGLTIGWAGGRRPEKDIEPMVKAWARIAEKYPAVTFVVGGYHARIFYKHLPAERIAALEWLPISGYPAGLLNIDIGCCPLADTPFNRAKTYIKAMEYAASGAAVVASPTVYGKLIEHGYDGFIAEPMTSVGVRYP